MDVHELHVPSNTSQVHMPTCENLIHPCKPGIVLPVWMPNEDVDVVSRVFRAIVYLMALVYAFLGSSVISDRFMTSIEVITSHVRLVKIIKPDGTVVNKSVRIWNETVAHLTLMEVGASASEILLTAIEIAGHGFTAGELGPSAIVGSAAFSLFLISSICVLSVPQQEVRRVQRMDIFW